MIVLRYGRGDSRVRENVVSDIVSTLGSALEKLARLEQQLGEADPETLRGLAGELRADLEKARTRASAQHQAHGPAQRRGPSSRDDKVYKCPVCTLRSFRAADDQAQGQAGEDSILYRCSSCGHEKRVAAG